MSCNFAGRSKEVKDSKAFTVLCHAGCGLDIHFGQSLGESWKVIRKQAGNMYPRGGGVHLGEHCGKRILNLGKQEMKMHMDVRIMMINCKNF
jgi:hypothetical protein